jgi:hypothetical protein
MTTAPSFDVARRVSGLAFGLVVVAAFWLPLAQAAAQIIL